MHTETWYSIYQVNDANRLEFIKRFFDTRGQVGEFAQALAEKTQKTTVVMLSDDPDWNDVYKPRQRTRNARFWTYINGDYAKLTLKPEQELSHCTGGPCDEGSSYEAHTWEHTGTDIRAECHTWGRDCDGRHSHSHEGFCPLDNLHSHPSFDYPETILLPTWERGAASQRDYSAEAMGY